METKRVNKLDLMKFIAIFFVVMCHGFFLRYDIVNSRSVKDFFNYYLMALFSTGVPLFFFVNGYLLFGKPFELNKHILRSAKLVITTVFGALPCFCCVAL